MTAAEERPGPALVEEVRRFGLVSADLVVDRFARLVDRALDADGEPAAAPPGGDVAVAAVRDGATGLAVAWLRLLEATASLADRASGAALGTLELPPTVPGSTVEGAVWVHNSTASPAPVQLTATTLAGPGRLAIPADAVRLGLEAPTVAARSSAEVRVQVDVPPAQEPGCYQGLVLATPAEQPVLLRLEVRTEGA